MTSTATAFALPDHLAHKADPALVAADERHFADHRPQPRAHHRRPVRPTRRRPAGTGRHGSGRPRPRPRGAPPHRPAARRCAATASTSASATSCPPTAAEPRLRRAARPHRRRRRRGCSSTGARRRPSRSSARPTPTRWAWSAAAATAGPTAGSATTGTRCSPPRGSRSHAAALDDQSAFIASLGSHPLEPGCATCSAPSRPTRTPSSAPGRRAPLVVDGGPGTGKTVVALHRTAYLLYSDPRLGHRKGGVLFVGPHQPYLAYVADVLPSLGEEGVQTCTAARPRAGRGGGRSRRPTRRWPGSRPTHGWWPRSSRRCACTRSHPPRAWRSTTPWGDVWLGAADWAEAFDTPQPGAAHNESRDAGLGGAARHPRRQAGTEEADEEGPDTGRLRRLRPHHRGPAGEVPPCASRPTASSWRRSAGPGRWSSRPTSSGDLWSVPAYLRRCAPWLERDEVFALQRDDPSAWTVSDLPLLDAARRRLGDPEASRRRARREAADAAERERMADVVADLIATDDSEMRVMSMLRGQDLRTALVDEDAVPSDAADLLAGPFAHVVVDEAQELTDAEWQMVLGRCPSRSLTIVGDRAQARHGFTESWQERLERVGPAPDRPRVAERQLPHAAGGHGRGRARHPGRDPGRQRADLDPQHRPARRPRRCVRAPAVLDRWLAEHAEGVACVIGDPTFADDAPGPLADAPAREGSRVRPRRARRPAATSARASRVPSTAMSP